MFYHQVFEAITMTSVPNFSSRPGPVAIQQLLANFPVGGADPDFNPDAPAPSKISAIPVVGKFLSQRRDNR